ncbi:MAG: glycosyltransferase family 2 protein [Planctomycetes bacterium]|nr:glycosyltransferase family 2 protein [Planctomycetota bacterium]
MNTSANQPLVSVGIPTYNRPEGLRRTLECVTNQSYTNLEIIVSDNCSQGKETQDVAREFTDKDHRVKYYRQDKNEYGFFNFKFVLENAVGEYFAWIADDDEWDVFFVEKCLSNIKNCSSAMCKIRVCYRTTGLVLEGKLLDLSPDYSKYRNYKESILNPAPSLIYSFYKRCDILWFLHSDIFDFSDCFLASKLLVQGNGIALIKDYSGYQTNIVGAEKYQYKPFKPADGRLFSYRPFVQHHLDLIANSSFSYFQKQSLKLFVFWRITRWFTKYEKQYSPIRIWLLKILIVRPIRSLIKCLKWIVYYATEAS